MITKNTLLYIVLGLLLLHPVTVYAENVVVRAGIHDRYNRLVFDWTRPVKFQLNQENGMVQIVFDIKATAQLNQALAVKTPFIRNLKQELTDKNLIITFQIPQKSRVQTFELSTKTAFDILLLDKAAPVFDPPKQAPEPVPQTPEKEAEKPNIVNERSVESEVKNPAQEVISTTQAQQPDKIPDQPKTLAQLLENKPAETQLQSPLKQQEIIKGTVIRLQPQQITRLAVFERLGRLWLVLDQSIPNLVPRVEGDLASQFTNVKRIEGDDATAFIFDLSDEQRVYSIKRDGNEWQLWINPKDQPFLPMQMPVTTTDEGDTPSPQVNFYAGEQPRVVTLKDTLLGDTLWIIPVRSPESRNVQPRITAAYKALPTIIGAVILPQTDVLRVKTSSDMVILTSAIQRNLPISPADDRNRGRIDPKSPQLFRLDIVTKGKRITNFQLLRQKLEKDITLEKDDQAKSVIVMDLARLYLQQGFGQEAAGLMRMAMQMNPRLQSDLSLHALRGMAASLSGDIALAESDLTTPEIQSYPLSKLWLGYAFAKNNNWINARASFIESGDAEQALPESLQPRIMIAKAETALQAGDIMSASNIMKMTERFEHLMPNEKAALEYIKAKILIGVDKGIKAIPQLENLVNGTDQLYRAKAEMDLIEQQVIAKQIENKEAIDRLERLRFSWRGDRLEVKILQRLGQYYINDKKYMEGLDLWRQSASLATEAEDTDTITKLMQDVFKKLYVDEQANSISPLQAVAIYERFRELTPTGEDGNIAIQHLADRLISVDLLDQADEMLQNQLLKHADGMSAIIIGTKLANLRLINNNPAGALKALDESERTDVIDPELNKVEAKRQLLRARALADTNKIDEALQLLQQNMTADALRLKVDINWRESRWSEAVVSLQALVSLYRDKGETAIDGPLPALILKMAIALSLDANQKGIELLNTQYGGFMMQTKLADSFSLITKPSRGSNLADLETLKSQVGEVELFEDFLKNF